MTGSTKMKRLLFCCGLFVFLVLPACSAVKQAEASTSQVVEVTKVVENTVVITRVVEVEKVVTATMEPVIKATAAATGEPAVQATVSTAAAVPSADGFTGWCVPNHVYYSPDGLEQAGAMPEMSNPVEEVNGQKQVVIEVQNCSFVYTLGDRIPAGIKVKMYDNGGSEFLSADLKPTKDFPNKGFVTITHPYVINPPFWSIIYRIDLVGADGKVLRSDTINFKRGWTPRACYDGSWPDPVTLKCKFMGEAHPWDPWYGKENPYEPTVTIDE